MPARDVYHDQFKAALIKDGWKITHDPLSVKWNEKVLFVDLGAEEVLAAEKDGRKIGVEVKSFVGPSEMAHQNYLAPIIYYFLYCWNGCFHPAIICYFKFLIQRHIKINPHKHTLRFQSAVLGQIVYG